MSPVETRPRPAVFLDRDGTIMPEREYLSDPDGVDLLPGAVEAMRELQEAGYALVVVTNQSGIARGLYTVEDYHAVAGRLTQLLADAGLAVDATYFCPHHPSFSGPCSCRKPATGMYESAAHDLGLELSGSYFVGDRLKDVIPAESFSGKGILVRTGYGAEEERGAGEEVQVVDSLLEAARLILARE